MIWVDRRIGSNDLPQYLIPLGIPTQLTGLEYGDCCWLGHGPQGVQPVGVELKTVSDLLNSLTSGRLVGHQIPGLVKDYPLARYLVIEGPYRPGDQGVLEVPRGRGWEPAGRGGRNWMYRDLEAWLVTLEEMGGIRIRRTYGRQETAQWIKAAWGWWQKEWSDHKGHRAHYVQGTSALFTKPSLRIRVALELPGVGFDRAQSIAAHFGSVRAMCEADSSDWEQIGGIGRILSARIVKALNGQTTPGGDGGSE